MGELIFLGKGNAGSGLAHPLARAIFVHCLVVEVHPFADGNGRLARIMMGAELKAAGLSRIVVPHVAKRDYISALRELSLGASYDPIVRCLVHCQEVTAAISEPEIEKCVERWASTFAFLEPDQDLSLILPMDHPVETRNGVSAPAGYWRMREMDRLYP
jgi:hypothetical protein